MTFKKRILSRCMVTMFIMGMISLSACGKTEVGSSSVESTDRIQNADVQKDEKVPVAVSEPSDESNGTNASNDESMKEDEEKASEYWYIDIRFRDAVGHEFVFSEPDEKGNPTKITLSGFSDENNGTFDFITEPNTMSPAETPDDPWIIGSIIGSGDLMKKDELSDDQSRFIGVDIWFAEDTTNLDPQNGTAVSLGDFIGDYKGINPFYVIDWTTYEMSEDVDHSFLSVVKKEDGYEVKDINIDSTSPKRHMTLEPIFLKDSDVSYYLDTDNSGGDDYWDCFLLEMDDADIIFSKWRKNGQLMVTIDLGDGSPLMFISK